MRVVEIIFSPTGGTARVAHILGDQLGGKVSTIDLCAPHPDYSGCKITSDDIAVIAMPSFGGRVPGLAIERLQNLKGNGAKAVLVCVYGNRAFEDTLVEMEDAAKGCGFKVIAAVAAVAEHSVVPQFATSRPDEADKKQLQEFAERIKGKDSEAGSIPGNRPYKESGGNKMVPSFNSEECIECGSCMRECPVQAIDTKTFESDADKCISCMRCVRACPSDARQLNSAITSAVATALEKVCSVRKENELFL